MAYIACIVGISLIVILFLLLKIQKLKNKSLNDDKKVLEEIVDKQEKRNEVVRSVSDRLCENRKDESLESVESYDELVRIWNEKK